MPTSARRTPKLRIANSRRRTAGKVLRFGTLLILAALMIFPIYWLVIGSFRSYDDTLSGGLVPRSFTLSHYRWVVTETFFPIAMKNSLLVSAAATLVSLVLGLLGAFSISRFLYPGRRVLSQLTLFAYLVPPILLSIPIFNTIKDLGLYNTLASLVLADTAFILPYCLWMLRGFVRTIPEEIEEAAMIDGCTRLGALVRIVLPLTAPGIVAAAMFAWVLAWNDYLFALILIRNQDLRTVPLHLAWYLSNDVGIERWGPGFAEAVLVALPVVIVFVLLQRYLVQGMMGGAVK